MDDETQNHLNRQVLARIEQLDPHLFHRAVAEVQNAHLVARLSELEPKDDTE